MRLTTTTTLLSLLALLPLTSAISITIPILSSPKLPNPSTLSSTTTATLTRLGKIISVPLSTSNSFDFRNVSVGSWLFDVACGDVEFGALRVDVFVDGKGDGLGGNGYGSRENVEAWRTFRGNEWGNKGEKMVIGREGEGEWVQVEGLRALGGKEYFIQRQGFSPLSLLKNPMILIAGVSMIVVFGMPYLMDNMDPEMRAEFEEAQKSSPMAGLLGGGGAKSGAQGFDAAGWLAGQGKGKDGATGAGAGAVKR